MGNLRISLYAVGLVCFVACKGGGSKPDAPIIVPDAPIDAKMIDAMPDAVNLDFTCLGMPLPTTADNPITLGGGTAQLTLGGVMAEPAVTVKTFKIPAVGPAMMVDQVTSAADGSFAGGNIPTAGLPVKLYVEGEKTGLRTTFVFPPLPTTKSSPNVGVLLATPANFTQLAGIAGATQDDTTNGAFLVSVRDCKNMPVTGATLTVKQGATDVGTVFDLGALSSMAAGVFFVFNVPAGNTDVGAMYMGMTFLTHSVISFKKNATDVANGSITTTIVRPGP